MNSLNKHPVSSPKYLLISLLKFLIPSAIGIFLFMIPLSKDGSLTIPIALLSTWLQENLATRMTNILLIIVLISSVGALITKLFKPNFILKNTFLNSLFHISWLWLIIRILSVIFIATILFSDKVDLETLPHFLVPLINSITSLDTGSLVLLSLLPILFSIFLFAGLFLPLLLNFGLLEFAGALLVRVMRPVFNLPGRSAIDCLASWLGDGTIGILLTSKQYEDGFYTQREAAVISTTFSLVSITFSLVVIDTVGLSHMFIPFYLTVTLSSLIVAIILPKLPPLSRKKDVLYDGSCPTRTDETLNDTSHIKQGFEKALITAKNQNIFQCVMVEGSKNVIDMWIGIIPVVMTVGTLALILATYTPVFQILGIPFLPILKLLGVPEAAAASQTLVAGFADMLLPSVMAASIESEFTRFIVASLSVTQLIYLSEVGSLIIASKIPIKFKELFIIFIERTLISLPIVVIIARLIF